MKITCHHRSAWRPASLTLAAFLLCGVHTGAEGMDLLGDEPKPVPAAEAGVTTDPDADVAIARRAQANVAGLVREGLDCVRRYNQDPARNATAIVDAAIFFGKARAMLPSGVDPDFAAEIQANLFWCKKQMNLDALKDYVARKGDDFQVAATQMAAVAEAKVDPAHAAAYFARADRFATANPGDHLQIAIRFTEVAERFPGTSQGTESNRRAAASIQAQLIAIQQMAQAARETRFTRHARPVPGATPVPSAVAQKDALALIKKNYAKQYAKREELAKDRLARRLIEDSAKNASDPAVHHQMLSEAVRLAVEAESYEPLLDGTERLAATFAGVDLQAERQAALKRLGSKPVATAIAKLLVDPRDPAANLVAGRWYGFSARRWEDAFRMLALGSDPDLARIAEMELAKPKGASEAMQTADAWHDGAQKQKGKDDKVGMLARAMFWYQQSVGGIDGLAKQRVQQRIAEIDKQLPLDLDKIDWANLTSSQWDKLKGRAVVVNARVDRFDSGIALGASERVRVVPHPTDTWTIVVDTFFDSKERSASCNWRGYDSQIHYSGQGSSNPGALMAWVETREKQNAGILSGPGRIYFSPHILWSTGDRSGTIRVKLVPVADDDGG